MKVLKQRESIYDEQQENKKKQQINTLHGKVFFRCSFGNNLGTNLKTKKPNRLIINQASAFLVPGAVFKICNPADFDNYLKTTIFSINKMAISILFTKEYRMRFYRIAIY